MQDPLQILPVEKWPELQTLLKSDWPRSMPGIYALGVQRRWNEQGCGYGFKVYCPYGDLWSGMVAVNEMRGLYEVMILCPRDDTQKLEEALRTTSVINWKRSVQVPYVCDHIMDCINRVKEAIGVEIGHSRTSLFYSLTWKRQPFEDISLPPGITFNHLTEDHIKLIDNKWPYSYPGSEWYFQHLIRTENGYGLYQNNRLAAWIFIIEMGALAHLYVLEEYRRKGFAELIVKLLCNQLLEDRRDVLVFCLKDNEAACNLYQKLNFQLSQTIIWCSLEPVDGVEDKQRLDCN